MSYERLMGMETDEFAANFFMNSLVNAGGAALIAKSDDRKNAAIVGAIAAIIIDQIGIFHQPGGLIFLPLPGIATGIFFRMKAKKDEA